MTGDHCRVSGGHGSDSPARERENTIPERPRAEASWLTAAEVADLLRVGTAWVYNHADQLGAIRLGSGPKPRLRFDPVQVSDALASCSANRGSAEVKAPANFRNPGHRRRLSVCIKPPLLPVKARPVPIPRGFDLEPTSKEDEDE